MYTKLVEMTIYNLGSSLSLRLRNNPRNHFPLDFAGVLGPEPMTRQRSRKRKNLLLGFVACPWECRVERRSGLSPNVWDSLIRQSCRKGIEISILLD